MNRINYIRSGSAAAAAPMAVVSARRPAAPVGFAALQSFLRPPLQLLNDTSVPPAGARVQTGVANTRSNAAQFPPPATVIPLRARRAQRVQVLSSVKGE